MSQTLYDVFVYGTLKSDGTNNRNFLDPGTLVGKYKTTLHFMMKDSVGFPYAVLPTDCVEDTTSDRAPIEGELYRVDKATLDKLDLLEGVSHNHFTRIKAWVKSEAVNGAERFAQMYVVGDEALEEALTLESVKKNTKGVLSW